MKKINSLIILCLSSLTVNSFASQCVGMCVGNSAGDVTLTIGAGEFFFSTKRNMVNTSLPLVALAFNFTNHWGIEGFLSGYNTAYKSSEHDHRQINGTVFAADVLYHFTPYYFFQPYVLAGVGVIGMNPNRNDANNEGNINAGIGAQFFVHPAIAFRLEGRDFYTWVGEKNDVMVDGGVSFLFDLC